MSINYDNKIFKSISNTHNGEVDAETTFYYQQKGRIVTAVYQGGNILMGNLIATVDEAGKLDMRYQHLNQNYEFMTGRCISVPEVLENGKIRMYETWQWTSGDGSSGESVVEEV